MAKKRKKGEGTIRLRKDGRWEGRVVIGYDEGGNPKTKNVLAKTKKECAERLEQLKKEQGGSGPVKVRSEMRFGDWLDFWYQSYSKGCMFHRDGVIHCLLALGQGSNDGVLVDAEQHDCARLAAFVPGMRDIVNAQMDRAADFIIRWGTESTTSGSWCVYFDDLEEHLDLTVREGSGLDSMLRAALKRRPEVAAVDMHDGCIETEYHPEYCQRLSNNFEPENKPLRLKDIFPLLSGGSKVFLCHEEKGDPVPAENMKKLIDAGQGDFAALLNAQVLEIRPTSLHTWFMLNDVAPEELVRLHEAYDAFREAERSMGPVMG